jgi:chaperone required for assembly of F1-ATPase
MKRFWNSTDVKEGEGGFTILLDDKPMRLSGGETLRVAHRPLAEAIAEEWRAVSIGTAITSSLLPLTQLAAIASYRIAPAPSHAATAIATYARSDLLCYRAEEPPELARRQQEAWQPWLDWVTRRYDTVLAVTTGILLVDQSPQTLAALSTAVAAHDAHGLASLGVLVPVFGSVVLGLAVTDGMLTDDEAFQLSALDALFQEEHWGKDPEATALRARSAQEVKMAARYFLLTRGFQ